jgi:hypothetical protein
MVEAAKLANYLEHPTNRLLTIRTSGMVLAGEGGVLRHHMPAERIIDYLDRHTRWCKQRDFRSHHIWVREFGAHHNDHFHMGFHMPPELDQAYITQVTNWLEEGVRSISGNTADLATSELNSWNIRRCLKGDTTGKNIARYLGKSEPNAYLDGWGRHRTNRSYTQKDPLQAWDQSKVQLNTTSAGELAETLLECRWKGTATRCHCAIKIDNPINPHQKRSEWP